MQLPSISLVIPCYNEASRLSQMFEGIKNFITYWPAGFQFIIINDGSTDDTAEIITQNKLYQNLLADDKIILINQKNCGKGGAIKNGIKYVSMPYVLTLDADMATNPTELLNWAKLSKNLFDNNTVSIASRTLIDSKLILISSRREKGNVFNTIVRKITGLPFLDTQCGFKLYPTPIAKTIFENLKTLGWAHDVEILLQLHHKKITVQELPIVWNERDASKINVWQDGLKMIVDVLLIKLNSK
jgi:dolichyl-phosphate beta-glucosyltransferase